MTGIERLRELSKGMHNHRVTVWQLTDDAYEERFGVTKHGPTIKNFLSDIADQIERETKTSSEVEKMKCGPDDVSMSAYDLLPEDEREAIAWVREHGGLSHVKDILHDFRAVVERIGIEWSESELHGLMDALDRRLMPEGYEWPRYESGDLVMFGDCVENRNGTCTVNSVRFYSGGGVTVYGEGRGAQFVVVTEPVMHDPIRKARPKVPAADGEPLEVGQTVWDVDSGIEYEVVGIHIDEDNPVRVMRTDGSHLAKAAKPNTLTHQRPVLDADGVPIHEGDTVWPKYPYEEPDRQVESAEVVYIHRLGRIDIQAKYATGMSFRQQVDAKQLTHTKPEPPDSWERIEEDADALVDAEINGEGSYNAANAYCNRRGLGEGTSFVLMAQDLVRRCRALAERERGE